MIVLPLKLQRKTREPLKLLCIGAHSDDIEIGCGGTILRLLEENKVEVTWVVMGSNGKRDNEAELSARQFLSKAVKTTVFVGNHRDGFFPYAGRSIKETFERFKRTISPDIIFTHYRRDLHQDHRTISDLTWNTYRDHLIFEYEILKYDGDLGSPNVFIPLSKEVCERKIGLLIKTFKSQANKDWFTDDAFWSILRIRGIECRAPSKFAEAFYCRKAVL